MKSETDDYNIKIKLEKIDNSIKETNKQLKRIADILDIALKRGGL